MKPKGLVAPLKIAESKASTLAASCIVVCQDEEGRLWQMPATHFNREMYPYRENYPDFRKWCEDATIGMFHTDKVCLNKDDFTDVYIENLTIEASYLKLIKRAQAKRQMERTKQGEQNEKV